MGIYDFTVIDNKGKEVSLRQYQNKVLLIMNSATQCGYTPQYERLESIYEKYKDKGFVILDFPCDQWHQAEGSNEEIASFCESRFGVTFPIFSKIEVKGENAIPLFKYLINEKGFKGFPKDNERSVRMHDRLSAVDPEYHLKPDIKWNFTKFLVDRNGNVVERFESMEDLDLVEEKIKELL